MKKIFEEPGVGVDMIAIEDEITASDNTGAFDGEWVPIGGK